MQFTVATNNKDKMVEIKEIIKGINANIISIADLKEEIQIIENGSTFEENALIKAKAVHDITGGYVMADDSGLSIKALDGRPGIHSARFAGENTSYDIKIKKIWEELYNFPDKTASFICAIAIIRPDKSHFIVRGEIEGEIQEKQEGKNGFGYDPIFYVPEYNMTTASMSSELKNKISHRGIALRLMMEILKKDDNLFN